MKNRLIRRARNLRVFLAFALLFVLLAAGFVWVKKDSIRAEFGRFFTNRAWTLLGVKVHVDRFGGNIVESLALRGVRVSSPTASAVEGLDTVFEAEEISFHYRIPELITGNFAGWFRIVMTKPAIYADVPLRPHTSLDPRWRELFRIFIQVLKGMRRKTQIVIRGGTVVWRDAEGAVSGVEGTLQDQEFNLALTLNHVGLAGNDLSTELNLRGHLKSDAGERQTLIGFVMTRGTIINWKPVPHESKLSFTLTDETLTIADSSILAGFEMKGAVHFTDPPDMNLIIRTKNYPLDQLNEFLILPPEKQLSGIADVSIDLDGSPLAPMTKGEITIKDSRMSRRPIKNMQIHLEGVYPDLRISNSRVVLEDGTTMAFAKENVSVSDLFSSRTYEALVTRTDQDDVIWGDWRLKREEREESMVIQRDLGNQMNVKYEKFEQDEADVKSAPQRDEVELEYLLSGKDSFKVKLKDDEEFVGVEKKMSF